MEGLAQKEIAKRLGVTETVVENEASRSLRAILKLMVDPVAHDAPATLSGGVSHVRTR
jgi:RNA polymerase sigma-70 factor (ECF subfamily)